METKVTKKRLEAMARRVYRHGNIRIGKANVNPSIKVGLYNGPNIVIDTETKNEMYFYLLGRIQL